MVDILLTSKSSSFHEKKAIMTDMLKSLATHDVARQSVQQNDQSGNADSSLYIHIYITHSTIEISGGFRMANQSPLISYLARLERSGVTLNV